MMTFALSSTVSSNDSTGTPKSTGTASLSPFKATYHFQWQDGITLQGEATRQLTIAENQSMSLVITAKVFASSMKESSQFSLANDQVSPSLYTSHRKAFLRSKRTQIIIDQVNKKSLINQKNTVTFATDATIHDNLSMQLQLQLDAKNAHQAESLNTPFQYTLATNNSAPSLFEFHYQDTELLKVPYGEFETIKLKRTNSANNERNVYIWFAPALDYQILRILQTEADGESFILSLKSID